eukprot:1359109-Pyramimonas_sp.AAC.1
MATPSCSELSFRSSTCRCLTATRVSPGSRHVMICEFRFLLVALMLQVVPVNTSSHGPLAELLEADQPMLGAVPSVLCCQEHRLTED